MTPILPSPLPLLARSFLVQVLLATAIIALVTASVPATTVDPATVSPNPTTFVAR